MSVRLVTNVGELTVRLHTDGAPQSSRNFIKLCKAKYYHWCIFHRVERDFVAQCGDPTGTGIGGQSFDSLVDPDAPRYIKDEVSKRLRHDGKGVLAMARAGKDRNGSQFYITLTDRPLEWLDGEHTVFGRVTTGLEVLDRINEVFLDDHGRPLEDIYIQHATVLEDPFPDPPGMPDVTASPPPSSVFLERRRTAVQEAKETQQVSETELETQRRRDEARQRAVTLEMLGERASAEMRPPENILFVCKLNPLTEADDLRTIFSRFGAIRSCDIVKDRKTQASLGYAFIDFEKQDSCEEAYLKMDNVLIDDRRIKVDFSQSVSKLNKGSDRDEKKDRDERRDRNERRDRREGGDRDDRVHQSDRKRDDRVYRNYDRDRDNRSDDRARRHHDWDRDKRHDDRSRQSHNRRYREKPHSRSRSRSRSPQRRYY